MEALGFGIMQIAGQAERMAANVDVALQHIGTLLRIADDTDAGAGPGFRQPAPQVWCDEITFFLSKLLHALVSFRLGIVSSNVIRTFFCDVANETFRRLPRFALRFPANDL